MIKTLFVIPAFLALTAGETPPPQPPSGTTSDIQGKQVSAQGPEVDVDIGIPGYAPKPCSPVFGSQASLVGPSTGDTEKDSYAMPVVGEVCR